MKPPGGDRRPDIFITGTDTGIGKTRVAAALIRSARRAGIRVCGFKPVASGCRRTGQGLRNDDALDLLQAAGDEERYERVNPYAFLPAVAPHLAAREAGTPIRRAALDRAYRSLARDHDWLVIEGAGGWQVPLGARWTFADWVQARRWPVVLVVGMRLGCLNHALLSAESIQRRAPLLGWIANELPPRQPRLEDNLAELVARMPAPLLGRLGPRQRRLDDGLRRILGELRKKGAMRA